MKSKGDATRGPSSRKSARAPLGEVWDKTSAVQEFDGRENMRDPNEADENGKWNKFGKSRPPVILTRDITRKVSK